MSGTGVRGRVAVLNWRDRRHPSAGAAELYCERVARELAAGGDEVVVVTARTAGAPAREVVDGYRVRRLGGRATLYPLALLWLLRHRGELDAVVDSQNGIPFFSPLVLRRTTPVLLLVHHVHQDLFARALPAPAAAFARWLEGPASRWVYHRRTVAVLSPSRRTEVRRRLRLTGRIRVVPCGADTSLVERRRARVPRIVVVGRLVASKRLDDLVAAMADVQVRLPAAELHLVGDGPERAALATQAERLAVHLELHGRLSDADRDAVLATAWLTVSASDGSDWGLSLVEANAAGVPALARGVPGARDAVRHGESGWLVDADQRLSAQLVRALRTLAPAHVDERLSRRAREWAAQFSWARTCVGVREALASERARLQRTGRAGRDRRTANDVAVVVQLPESALPSGWQAGRRAGDAWVVEGSTARGLLLGADEVDALAVLHRLDVDPRTPGIEVLVARHVDLLRARHSSDDPVELVELVTEEATVVDLDALLAPTGGGRRAA